jgi:hypothetical protein
MIVNSVKISKKIKCTFLKIDQQYVKILVIHRFLNSTVELMWKLL